MREQWRQSPFSGIQISNKGELRDTVTKGIIEVPAYETKPGGPVYKRFRGRYIHEMVLTTFVGPRPPRQQARHLDGNSLRNWLENLRWGTPSEDNYDRVRHGTHQHTRRTDCKHGHPLDGIVYNTDGSIKQRFCTECRRICNRKRRAAKQTCPQGHPFDGIRYRVDGSIRQRYCTICVGAQMAGGRKGRNFVNRTHCKRGHPLDGVSTRQRFCKTCKTEQKRKARGY